MSLKGPGLDRGSNMLHIHDPSIGIKNHGGMLHEGMFARLQNHRVVGVGSLAGEIDDHGLVGDGIRGEHDAHR